jgi:hypothetical protein
VIALFARHRLLLIAIAIVIAIATAIKKLESIASQ